MDAHLEESAGRWAGCGLMTGIGGWAVVLDELAAAAGDEDIAERARRVLHTIAGHASADGDTAHWHDLTEMVWGTAGIGCLMLTLGPGYLGPAAVDLAVRAGDWLARLAQVTGEERFLAASLAATGWIMTTVRTEDDTCAACHHDPGGTDLYTLGWCHGPPGLGWLFRQLELTTGSQDWRTWLRRAARADLISGIPARREPGFWDNVARCGSAGVAEFFLDLRRLEHADEDLAFAVTMVDDILDRAIVDELGMRWSNYEFRSEEPDLPPETTYLQGAPGIGSTLLRLHRRLAGDPWTVRWPHAPDWTAAP